MPALTLTLASGKVGRRLQSSREKGWCLLQAGSSLQLPRDLCFPSNPSLGTSWPSVLLLQWFSVWLPRETEEVLELSSRLNPEHWETVLQSIYALLAHRFTSCHTNKRLEPNSLALTLKVSPCTDILCPSLTDVKTDGIANTGIRIKLRKKICKSQDQINHLKIKNKIK